MIIASQRQSVFFTDWLCITKPFHREGLALHNRKASQPRGNSFASKSQFIGVHRICFAKPTYCDWLACFAEPICCGGLALLRQANPLWRNGFASQSHSIVMDWLCFAKPILCKGLALLRKAFPSWLIRFPSQSQSFVKLHDNTHQGKMSSLNSIENVCISVNNWPCSGLRPAPQKLWTVIYTSTKFSPLAFRPAVYGVWRTVILRFRIVVGWI